MSKASLTVLFDANPLANAAKSGVGYYTKHLIEALAANYPDDVHLVGHYFNFLGRKTAIDLPTAPNISYVQSKLLPGKVLSLCRRFGFQLPLELLFKQRGSFALFTNFVSLPSLTRIPRVVAVHDLTFIDFPEYMQPVNQRFLQRFVPRSLASAALVITISDSTKQGIIKHYGTPADQIVITHIPPAKPRPTSSQDLTQLGITKPFILFVSTLEPRKNVGALVAAYEHLPEAVRANYQLVLAGGMGWHMDATMQEIVAAQHRGAQIITTGYIDDSVKAALYKNASLFVMPSHYEGFGMPLLEAAQAGVPLAVSDIAVFHEVAGDAAVYFDQNNPTDMAKKIADVLENKPQAKALVEKGTKNLARFSWQSVAQTVYKALLKVGRR